MMTNQEKIELVKLVFIFFFSILKLGLSSQDLIQFKEVIQVIEIN